MHSKRVLMLSLTLGSMLVLAIGCFITDRGIFGIGGEKSEPSEVPVVVGRSPDESNIGTWRAENFRMTSDGDIAGTFEMSFDDPSRSEPAFMDVLFAGVVEHYSQPDGSTLRSEELGAFIPVEAQTSTQQSATFVLDGAFPTPEQTDGGLPLHHLQLRLDWLRVTKFDPGAGTIVSTGGTATSSHDPPDLGEITLDDPPQSLTGTLAPRFGGELGDYREWIMDNAPRPTPTPAAYPGPSPPGDG